MTFTNWKAVEEFLESRANEVGEDGRAIAVATKEEIEEVAGVELRFNDELKIEDPELITIVYTKEIPNPDGEQKEVINYDHRSNDKEDKPVRITVYLD
jgi:hypothetical protein